MNEAQVRREFRDRREDLIIAHNKALVALDVARDATVDALKVAAALQSVAVGIAKRAGEE